MRSIDLDELEALDIDALRAITHAAFDHGFNVSELTVDDDDVIHAVTTDGLHVIELFWSIDSASWEEWEG